MTNAPPPVLPTPPKPGMSTGKIVLLVGLLVGVPCIGLIGAMGWLLTKGVGMVKPIIECERAFEDVREAIRLYAADHGGKLPPAATWQDDVKDYLAKVPDRMSSEGQFKIEKLDPNAVWGCKVSDTQRTGMAFNAELAGKKLAEIKNPTTTILIFETPTGKKNLNMPYKSPPADQAPMIMGEHRPWFEMPVEGKKPFRMEKKVFEGGAKQEDNESNE